MSVSDGEGTLSGHDLSPCPDAVPADALSDLLRYTRLVKPFPIKRLSDVLYQVIATGNQVSGQLIDVQIAQPSDPENWVERLESLKMLLWVLGRYCEETIPQLDRMIDSADTEAERGEAAVRAIIEGLRAGR